MGLAEEADSTEVGAILPDDGQEGQVALTGPGNLSAGEDADAIGIQQQTDHHDGIEGRGAAGLVLVGGMDPREIERGDDIDQEEHEVVLRELGGGGVGPLGVELRCPRAIRFGAGWVHDRSHVRMGEDPSSSSPYGKIAQATKLSRSSESAVGFIDSLLESDADLAVCIIPRRCTALAIGEHPLTIVRTMPVSLGVPGTPYPTAWANSGKSGRARRERGAKGTNHVTFVPESGWPHSLFSGAAQVLAHESWPRIGRPRQQGRAGGIGSMAYEIM